jgi:hypothetical protein
MLINLRRYRRRSRNGNQERGTIGKRLGIVTAAVVSVVVLSAGAAEAASPPGYYSTVLNNATYIYGFWGKPASSCNHRADNVYSYTEVSGSVNLVCTFPTEVGLQAGAGPNWGGRVWRRTYGTGYYSNYTTEALTVDKQWTYADCPGMCLPQTTSWGISVGSGDVFNAPTAYVPGGRYHCFTMTTELWFPVGASWKVFRKVDVYDGGGNLLTDGAWSRPTWA